MPGIRNPSDDDVSAIVRGTHDDPFRVLGPHLVGGTWMARTFMPGAERVSAALLDGTPIGDLALRHPQGFFEGAVRLGARQPVRYHAAGPTGRWSVIDPYGFGPVLGPLDDYYSAEGTHLRLYDRLGAHLITHEGVDGAAFAVWAPNARRASVVGDFNAWDGRRHPMRRRADSGMWEIFIPGLGEGTTYKYELLDGDGRLLPLKSDPYGFAAEMRPGTASVIACIDGFRWTDGAYMSRRRSGDPRRSPLSIYEVHLGSWRRRDDAGFLGYDEIADSLIPYVREMGFTHVELLPVTEHPLDASWGYQPTGLFAPTSRFGDPAAFARFVDKAHAAGIGVILDWVPAHFPTDPHGLARFDGTALYEHEDPRLGFHPDWSTAIYNFGRREVASFLINNALFWLERYHIDGLRVDAVASMLYLDYSRKDGEWLPNVHGGRENLEAVSFLQRMNAACYGAHPGIMTIAEESTAWPSVSRPVFAGGLGFGFKWNMGFMHDTLAYLGRDPVHRRHHHDEITFGLVYAFSENFVLPLSHDEVVHGKRSLIDKVAGDDWQQFATLRAYYAFMWGYPGKKLLFMGQEFAQRREWNADRALDWWLIDAAAHAGIRTLVADLNRLYRDAAALHARDCEPEGFEWLIVDDAESSVFAWLRKASDGEPPFVVVANFTPVPREPYVLPLPHPGRWRERLNTDASVYGGSGRGNLGAITATARAWRGRAACAEIVLPPLATLYFEHAKD